MESVNHRKTNVSGRMYGSYPAIVESVEHPDGLYMAQVRLQGTWDDLDISVLPWAEFLLPLGAKANAGHGVPVEVGDQVWVDFPFNGDTRSPRITGSIYTAPEGKSNLPDQLLGEMNEDEFTQMRAEGEPPAPEYTAKDDIYSRFGLIEHKTAEGGWCITHKGTGSAIEINKDGIVVIHTEVDAFRSSTGNTTEQVGGNLEIKVTGNATVSCDGDTSVTAGGSALIDAGSTLDLKAGGAITIEAGAPFTVKAPIADFQLG